MSPLTSLGRFVNIYLCPQRPQGKIEGPMAEGLGKGLQNLVQQFKSASDLIFYLTSRGGEIGIHEGLKIPWMQIRVGSSPTRGTLKNQLLQISVSSMQFSYFSAIKTKRYIMLTF